MLSKIGHKNFTLLAQLMRMHHRKHKVIASNIANANTPYYRRRDFKFDTSLRNAMEGGTSADYRAIGGTVVKPKNTPIRNNGNDVDIDKEMLALSGNATLYDIYSHLYQKNSTLVKQAIRGGK